MGKDKIKDKNDRRRVISLLPFFILHFSLFILLACGDLFEYIPSESDCTMTFDRHEITVMAGDTDVVHARFEPDSIENQTIYWMSDQPSIATVENNLILALSPGDVKITGISIAHQVYDTCLVHVMAPWAVDPDFYAYDMVVYANPTFNGQPLTTQTVGAFCGNEVRGVGEWRTHGDLLYMSIRIYSRYNPHGPYSNMNPQDPMYPDEPVEPAETITFRLYDHTTRTIVELPETLTFDGETHGTLSNLYPMNFKQ